MSLSSLQSTLLDDSGIVRHGFFGREGGVSEGDFAGLNVSYSVGDDPEVVDENRALVTESLGGGTLVTLRQVHSNRVVTVEAGALPDSSVEADALVTRRADILIGVLTADCAPLLLLDRHSGIVGAAHAGWRGAVDGILGQTIAAMEALGAQRRRIDLIVGPTISRNNYEVGPQFAEDVTAIAPQAAAHLMTPSGGREHFDLPGFLVDEGRRFGLGGVSNVGECTYGLSQLYFSHRRATHEGTRTGRQISVIGLD